MRLEPDLHLAHHRADLQARLRAATPSDHAKGALFRAVCAELQQQLPPSAALDALLARHRKAAWQELLNYPAADFLRLGFEAAELLAGRGGTLEASFELLGGRVAEMFLRSAVGQVAVRLVAGKGPLEILASAPALYGAAVNYGERVYERLGPERAVLHVRRDFFPASYHRGVVRTGMAVLGHQVEVSTVQTGRLDLDAVVIWRGA